MSDCAVCTDPFRSGCIHDPWQDRRLLGRYQRCLRRSCTRAGLPGRPASYSMAPQLHKPLSPCSHFYQYENGLAGVALFCFVTCLNVVTLCFLTATHLKRHKNSVASLYYEFLFRRSHRKFPAVAMLVLFTQSTILTRGRDGHRQEIEFKLIRTLSESVCELINPYITSNCSLLNMWTAEYKTLYPQQHIAEYKRTNRQTLYPWQLLVVE
jgi:hypothetical protein